MRATKIGVMVSLEDCASMSVPGSDFSEVLLFNGDLEQGVEPVIDAVSHAHHAVKFVHAQEFVHVRGAEMLVDLSSENDVVRTASVAIVSATRDIAVAMGDVRVVIHPGGIRSRAIGAETLASNLADSLTELGPERLLLENMPWHYWHGKMGRLRSNVCTSIEDLSRFEDLVEGFTLDTCHGYLSVPEGDPDYCRRFIEELGNKLAHIHASDARPPDREGLQIGEGDIDFSFLRYVDVPILAEVWNGHANGGEGFRIAIKRLRAV